MLQKQFIVKFTNTQALISVPDYYKIDMKVLLYWNRRKITQPEAEYALWVEEKVEKTAGDRAWASTVK
jgi:hypothetical protein